MSTPVSAAPRYDDTYKPPPPKPPAFYQVLLLFVYHLVLGLALAYAIYNVWPPQPWPGDIPAPPKRAAVVNPANTNVSNEGVATTPQPTDAVADVYPGDKPPKFKLFGKEFQPTLEVRLLLLVMLAGAIGSYVHATSSLVDYLGNRTLISSWVWWYLLRPFIGLMLALIFYFVFRGGFITAGVNAGGEGAAAYINPFGVAALAGLVGMFSKVAADKLNEVFITLFRPERGDADRGDKLNTTPAPTLTGLVPKEGPATGRQTVMITGTGFAPGATVTFDQTPATNVTVVSDTSITAVTPAHDPGVVAVAVVNTDGQKTPTTGTYTYLSGGAGGGGGATDAPTIKSITPPTGASAGGDTVTILGTNFADGASVTFGGADPEEVTMPDANSLIVMTPAHAAGAVDVVVTNPDGQSATTKFTYT